MTAGRPRHRVGGAGRRRGAVRPARPAVPDDAAGLHRRVRRAGRRARLRGRRGPAGHRHRQGRRPTAWSARPSTATALVAVASPGRAARRPWSPRSTGLPSTDFVALVDALRRRYPVELVEAPPAARRVGSLERRAGARGAQPPADQGGCSASGEVLGEGDLEVARACSGRPRPGGRRSGPSRRRCRCPRSRRRRRAAYAASRSRGAEGLRGLHAVELPAGSGRGRRGPAGRAARTTGIAPPCSRAAAIVAAKSAAPASGRAPSWIATTSTSPDSIAGPSARSAAPLRGVPGRAALDQADLGVAEVRRERGRRRRPARPGGPPRGRGVRRPAPTRPGPTRPAPGRRRAAAAPCWSRLRRASRSRRRGSRRRQARAESTDAAMPAECFHGCYTTKQVLDASPLRSGDQEGAARMTPAA